MDVTCSVDGCSDPVDRKGYCRIHYTRQWRRGTTGLVGPQPKPCRTCGIVFQPRYNRNVYCSDRCRLGAAECETCGKTFLVKDGATGKYCSRDCWYAVDRASRPCPVCGNPFKGSGLTCSRECSQERQRADREAKVRHCANPACTNVLIDKKSKTKYCSRPCAMACRADRRGAPAQIGTRRQRDDGYIEVKVRTGAGGWVLEHRYQMERLLGRSLLPGETAHHRNGDRSDNAVTGELVEFRSGNLELWSTAQPKGQRVEDKVEWAVELLKLYRPDLLAEQMHT